MLNRLAKVKKSSFFLFGPRGTGKTQWVRTHFKDALYIDLLNTRDYQYFLADPTRLEGSALGHKTPWIVLDEVQKVPLLLDEVHRLIENHQRCFVLTGSSARKLRRGGANLLAGRALLCHMHPLIATEIGETFDLERALRYGLLPKAYLETNPGEYLESYIGVYLQEEVVQEGLLRDVGVFARFLEIASFSQASQLNLSAVAQECGISQKVVREYFQILNDLLLAIQLECFDKRAQRKLAQHPKFYYFDAGVYQYIRPRGPLDVVTEVDGAALETLFLQHLRAIIDYHGLSLKIYFWRTVTQLEIDFIVYGEQGLFAFEVKNKSFIRNTELRALKEFKKDYPMAQCYLIYRGERIEKRGDIRLLPARTALFQLAEILGARESG